MGSVNNDRDLMEPNEWARTKSINDVINFFRASGLGEGSCDRTTVDWPRTRNCIAKRFAVLTGENLWDSPALYTPEGTLQKQYEIQRKHGYKILKKGEPIRRNLPLFPGPDDTGCLVYAYIGSVGTKPGLLFVKIGFTSQDIQLYLATKRIAHNPRLLATTLGDRVAEAKIHRQWGTLLVEGREWFDPQPELTSWIKADFTDIEPRFDELVAEAISVNANGSLLCAPPS